MPDNEPTVSEIRAALKWAINLTYPSDPDEISAKELTERACQFLEGSTNHFSGASGKTEESEIDGHLSKLHHGLESFLTSDNQYNIVDLMLAEKHFERVSGKPVELPSLNLSHRQDSDRAMSQPKIAEHPRQSEIQR